MASREVDIHPEYQQILLNACEADTEYFDNLFNVGWEQAPHRVIKNSTSKHWHTAKQPESGSRPGEGEVIGQISRATSNGRSAPSDVVRYMSHTPNAATNGDIEAMSMWAGQSVGLVKKVCSAATIVEEITQEAENVLRHMSAQYT